MINQGILNNQATAPTQLTLDRLMQLKKLGVAAQEVAYRPFYQLKSENVGSAFVIHQYSLGQDELAFAYGAAAHAANYTYLHSALRRGQVAVLGSGFTGLLTAIRLHTMGQAVTVYDQQFPQHRVMGCNLKKPIGQVCTGTCLPLTTTTQFQSEKQEFVVRHSTAVFLAQVQDQKLYRGLSWEKGFCEGKPAFLSQPFIVRNVATSIRNVDGEEMSGHTFEYLQANPEVLLFQIYSEAKFRGVKFCNKKITTKEEIGQLAGIVINTKGAYGLICGDTEVKFKRRYYRYLEPVAARQLGMFSGRLQDKKMVVSCQSDKTVLLTGEEECQPSGLAAKL